MGAGEARGGEGIGAPRLSDYQTLGLPERSFTAGARLGRYVLQAELGRGGMGIVWRAQDEELERPVALKFLPVLLARDPMALGQLRREARAMLDLTHPGIVRLHTLDRHEDLVFLVMEHIAGPTLRALLAQRVARERTFTPAEARWVLAQLAPAIDYAHSRRVLHRDIKPANVMLAQPADGPLDAVHAELRLCDFGIAWVASTTYTQLTGQGNTTGTLPYMAPEVLEGARPTVASDVYALGVTLYELVRGELPFAHGDIGLQIRTREAPALASGDAGLDLLVAGALAKRAEDRPASVGEMVAVGPGDVAQQRRAVPEPAGVDVRNATKAGQDLPARSGSVTAISVQSARSEGRTGAIPAEWEELDAGDVGRPRRARDAATGIVFRLIPPGTFAMGSPEAESGRFDDEPPQRLVTISRAFWLAETPVTWIQWAKVDATVPVETRRARQAPGILGRLFAHDAPARGSPKRGREFGYCPVTNVSWEDASAFCRKAGYRLPTEAEWEYACRAGTTTAYWSGETEVDLGKVAWYFRNTGEAKQPVGTKPPNAWGLHDMHGNVWEWCADTAEYKHRVKAPVVDPHNDRAGESRSLRGGCWRSNPDYCRSAYRHKDDRGYRGETYGFRPARNA